MATQSLLKAAFLDGAWANQHVNVVTIVAWAGAGKSTLVNHWLRQMAVEHYRSAELVFGWSFYRQGRSRGASSADEFLDAALNWFGDPDPRLGTAWEKGERLAKLIAHRRTLLVLDGLMGAEETKIEVSFRAAISTARAQKSISLAKRAEGSYAEHRRLKATEVEERGLPLG